GGPRCAGGFEDRFEFGIVERRDHRGGHHADLHAGLRQPADRVEPALRGGGARLHRARKFAVQRRDRDEDMREIAGGHRRDDVEIAQHECRFRHDREGMAEIAQRLEDLARDAVLALYRLVGIGVGAKRDRQRLVAGFAQFARQQLRRVGFGEKLRLEIEAR
ncbi:unnamed protein product, partial [Phaeothamnion confervicola]